MRILRALLRAARRMKVVRRLFLRRLGRKTVEAGDWRVHSTMVLEADPAVAEFVLPAKALAERLRPGMTGALIVQARDGRETAWHLVERVR
ncbi:MAG: hypothetical protein FJW40_22180 [Acidobacteria bacterium]|nr:hypothetical protein [Acidobacteriota bacterium]